MPEIPRILTDIGWNRRPLGWDDLEAVCAELGVVTQRPDMKTLGMYFERDGVEFISVSSRICGYEQWHAGWHEFSHKLFDSPGLRCYSPSSISKSEAKADFIATVALLDEKTLWRLINGELHDYPHKLVKKRMRWLERLCM